MSIEKPKSIESFSYMGITYVSTEFLVSYFKLASRRTITDWIKKGLTPTKEKDLSKSNLFDLRKTIEWVEENINKTKSNNAKKKTDEPEELDEEEKLEELFEKFTKANSNDKRKMLIQNPHLIEAFNKIEDIIKKMSLNKEYDNKYVLKDDVKKGQQELASMFISFLKSAMPILSKNLENKTQQEIYDELDKYFSNQINHLVKYLNQEQEIIVTHYELIELIIELVNDEVKPIQILNKMEELRWLI